MVRVGALAVGGVQPVTAADGPKQRGRTGLPARPRPADRRCWPWVTRPVTAGSSRRRLACWARARLVAMASSWSGGDLLTRADDGESAVLEYAGVPGWVIAADGGFHRVTGGGG